MMLATEKTSKPWEPSRYYCDETAGENSKMTAFRDGRF